MTGIELFASYFYLYYYHRKTDLVSKKGYNKKNLVSTFSCSGGGVVFILLTEVIIFHIGFAVIHIWKTGFYGLILRFLRGGESLSLQNNLQNPLQVFFGIFGDRGYSNRDKSNGKVYFWGSSRVVR